MLRALVPPITVALLIGSPLRAIAEQVELGGYAASELRALFQQPQFPGQLEHAQPSLALAPELQLRTDDERHQFKLTPFLRADAADVERTHVDLREAYWRGIVGDWQLLVGSNVVFWGVTESRHLVDIVNQTDGLEDIDEEDKLGQPMINVEWQRPWGRVSGFVLIGFRQQAFPGVDGRLRGPRPVTNDAARFPDGRRDVDLALRYSHFLGDFDIGIYAFRGTGREPAFEASGTQITPIYRPISQVGLDLQYTRNAWLWKLEAIGREGEGSTFGAFVSGVEYTRYQVRGTAVDLGLLGEYLYDGRDATAPPTPFDNDAFAGARLAFNDTQDTTLLAGAIVDLADGSMAARVEAERRLTNRLRLEVESRFFANVAPGNLLQAFSHDSFLTARVSLFF